VFSRRHVDGRPGRRKRRDASALETIICVRSASGEVGLPVEQPATIGSIATVRSISRHREASYSRIRVYLSLFDRAVHWFVIAPIRDRHRSRSRLDHHRKAGAKAGLEGDHDPVDRLDHTAPTRDDGPTGDQSDSE
jgi:hypothetical protein